jgi:hypothetical protein
MLQLRKKREPLLRNHHKDAPYPKIMVALEENHNPDTVYEIAVIDINTTGMGIESSVPLSVGQSIFVDDNQPEWDLPKHGVVMWAFHTNDGFRAGIKFA